MSKKKPSSKKLTNKRYRLKTDRVQVISSIAATEAVKETTAYLASNAFLKLMDENNHKMRKMIRDELKDQEKSKVDAEKKRKENMIKNTELLIMNFRKCKEMVREIDLDKFEDEGTFLSSEELTLETLEKYRMKTYKMVRHIENMLVAYDHDTKTGTDEDRRRFLIMHKRYIADNRMSIKEIMESMHVGQSTVYSDTKKAIKDMSAFIFGYESVMFK